MATYSDTSFSKQHDIPLVILQLPLQPIPDFSRIICSHNYVCLFTSNEFGPIHGWSLKLLKFTDCLDMINLLFL